MFLEHTQKRRIRWDMGWWREHKHEVKLPEHSLKLGTSQTGFGKVTKER